VGAKAIAGIPNAANLELDLSGNNIGIEGIKALAEKGFKKLKLGGQSIGLSPINGGRASVSFAPPGGVQYVVRSSISGGGWIDDSKGVIVWLARADSTVYEYQYSYLGHAGTATLPFIYYPFQYTVTFNDKNGHITKKIVNDLDRITSPANPK
jgi:hypothetical protein